jgi:ABC-type sugar transport system substrate-binding protein
MGVLQKVFLLLLMACASVIGAEKKQFVIAFAQDNMANDFRKAQVLQAKEAAAKYPNVLFLYSDAKAKTSLLIRHIEQFIAEGADALIVGTNHPDLVVPAIERAYEKGIAVVIVDRGVNTDRYGCFIHSNNKEIGRIAARYLETKLPKNGTVLMLQGLENNDVANAREQGFTEVIEKHPRIKVIKRRGNYLRKDTILAMEALHKEGILYDAIYSHSDSMLSGVRTFYARHGLDIKKVPTVGVDYTAEAREAIKNGEQSATVLFPLAGKEAVQTAVKLLEKKEVPKQIELGVTLITKENIEKIQPIF